MKYMTISDPAESQEALYHRMVEDGYLLLKGFFSRDFVASLRTILLDVLTSRNWLTRDNSEYSVSEPVNRLNSSEFYACIADLMKSEKLHHIAYQPQLLSLLEALVQDQIFAHPRKMLRITYPYAINPKDRIPAHQDISYVKGEVNTFTVWTPLGDYRTADGGLEVAAKSHRLGKLDSLPNNEGRFGCGIINESLENLDWRHMDYEMGDVLIMHSLCVHQSGLNLSNMFRLSIDCRFSSIHGHINTDQLLPPYYPNVPGWDTCCKEWNNPNLFSAPSSLKLQDPQIPVEDILQLHESIPG